LLYDLGLEENYAVRAAFTEIYDLGYDHGSTMEASFPS
jgi:hypothetical protein